MPATRRREGLLFLALSAAAFVVYAPRTCRTLSVMGDSAELVSAAAQWGVPHPPGYPLYTLIAHIATRLPIFELPWRVHITSALFHAVTVAVVGATVDVLTGSLAAAFISAATLGLGRIFFSGSLYAEVFPLNDLFFAALFFLAVRFAHPEKSEGAPDRRPQALAAVLAVSFAHHHMIVLALPALGILVGPSLLDHLRERPGSSLRIFVILLAVPLAFYALVFVSAARHPVPSWGDVHDLSSLMQLVTRQDYGGIASASRKLAPGQLLERLDALAVGTAESFGAVGVLLFAAGAITCSIKTRRLGAALLTGVACAGPLFAGLNAFDIHSEYRIAFFERFTTMCHVPFSIVIGLGAAQCEGWLRQRRGLSTHAVHAAMACLIALAVGPLVPNMASLDASAHRGGLDYAHDLIDGAPDGAVILLKSDMASQAALYACTVEKRCGERIVLTPGQLWMPWKQREVLRRYPALEIPPAGVTSAARWIVEHHLQRFAVFVHPELIDEVVHGDMAIRPSLLLFRAYANEQALRSDLPDFRSELDAIAERRRCRGCALAGGMSQDPAEKQLAKLYEDALRAHATAAAQLGWSDAASTFSSWLQRGP